MYIGWDNQEHEDAEMDNMRRDAKEERGHMPKLAIIDIDGVIANGEARFAKAEEAKQEYMNHPDSYADSYADPRTATDVYWHEAFNPAHVPLDTLIEGADECITALTLQDYEIFFLTSRPSSMREATLVWLESYNLLAHSESWRLVTKAPAFQFVKTVTWKAGMVPTLAALMPEVTEVLFVSDVQKEIDEVLKYAHPFTLRCALSLDEAVNGKEEDLEHPF